MEASFRSRKLRETFNCDRNLVRRYGARQAGRIRDVFRGLLEAPSLANVPTSPPMRRHQLTGNRNEQFAVDLLHPYRLVFTAAHSPVPRRADGGIALECVTAIMILDVEDYH